MPKSVFVWLAFVLALGGCGALDRQSTSLSTQTYATEGSAPTSYGPYVLRPNDRIRLQVYDDQNITGEYLVDSSGFISVPLAGRIKAAGLTSPRLEQAVASRLSDGILKKPGVNIQIVAYAPFYIHGEVKRPGEFPYKPGMTVQDAVASAGGFTYRADETTAYLRRADVSAERPYPLNGRVPIFPGDNIRIPERFF